MEAGAALEAGGTLEADSMLVGATLDDSGAMEVGAAVVDTSGADVLAPPRSPPRPAPTLNSPLLEAAEDAAAAAGEGVEDYHLLVFYLRHVTANLRPLLRQQQLEEDRDSDPISWIHQSWVLPKAI